jgi:hypothetical protein
MTILLPRRARQQAVQPPSLRCGKAPSQGACARDFFVSHTQLDPKAKELAMALCNQLNEQGKTCWLDESFDMKEMDAAVRECDCLIAVCSAAGQYTCIRPGSHAATMHQARRTGYIRPLTHCQRFFFPPCIP